MQGNRFFSVPYDLRNDASIALLATRLGDRQRTIGVWVSLLGLLYDLDGNPMPVRGDADYTAFLMRELDMGSEDELKRYLDACARFGLIDFDRWDRLGEVFNEGVKKELSYRRTKSEAGRKGMGSRWSGSVNNKC